MQALSFDKKGDLSALALIERPIPVPGVGEVLVEVKAAGLNPSDVKNVLGFFPYTTLPRIPGRDFAGVVRQGPPELIGKNVWGTGLGLGFSQDGSHAEYLVLPAGGCALLPAKLSFVEAAACGVPYTTAWDGIRRAKVGPGKTFSGDRRQWRGGARGDRLGQGARRQRGRGGAAARTGGGAGGARL